MVPVDKDCGRGREIVEHEMLLPHEVLGAVCKSEADPVVLFGDREPRDALLRYWRHVVSDPLYPAAQHPAPADGAAARPPLHE